jgi:predicted ABC-type ATPase
VKVTGDKIFTIIAGINGAGKTSLYRVLHPTVDLGERINIDELALEHSGDWRDPRSQIYAGREAVARIRSCIENGRSFHLETTLPGASIIRHINLAKEHGFKVMLYFVGVDNVKVAMERVHLRMANGGHGVPDEFILKRYAALNGNLKQVLPLCDGAILFDNTVKFRQIAFLEDKRLIDCDSDLPYWFIDFIDELPD